MALDPITAGMDLAGKIIERIFPDKTEAEKAKLAMFQLQEQGALQEVQNQFNLSMEQVKVDAVEAASAPAASANSSRDASRVKQRRPASRNMRSPLPY